jgi:hypothetical protein
VTEWAQVTWEGQSQSLSCSNDCGFSYWPYIKIKAGGKCPGYHANGNKCGGTLITEGIKLYHICDCEFCGKPCFIGGNLLFAVSGWVADREQGGTNHVIAQIVNRERAAHVSCVPR